MQAGALTPTPTGPPPSFMQQQLVSSAPSVVTSQPASSVSSGDVNCYA